MKDFKGLLQNRWNPPIAGALLLHVVAFSALMTWRPKPLPPGPVTIPITLIELPPPTSAPEPELEPEPEPEIEPEPEETEEAEELIEPVQEDAPSEEEVETFVAIEPAPPAGISLAQTGEDDTDVKDAVTKEIPPEYVYTYDPFAETAPTALARVSRAVNCARANRETRPAFCPDYDEDDVFIATLSQNRGSAWGQASFDPVQDIAAYRSALGNFTAKQQKPQFTGKSESFDRTHPHDPELPDKGCRYISYGFSDPFALDKNAAVPDNRKVVCDQLE